MNRILLILLTLGVAILWLPASVMAAKEVGAVVQLRGTASIERPLAKTPLRVKIKDPIELKDTVETGERSRAKMLFVDESILTLSSNSRASIEKFVYSLEGRGASIFNLLEGTMRAVVGKTEFEVHTPTIVAAARGTVIEFTVGEKDGVPYTIVVCLEGTVTVKSKNPPGEVVLQAGEMIIVYAGQPMPEPWPYEGEEREPPGRERFVDIDDIIVTPTVVVIPPIEQDPPVGEQAPMTTPVDVIIDFP